MEFNQTNQNQGDVNNNVSAPPTKLKLYGVSFLLNTPAIAGYQPACLNHSINFYHPSLRVAYRSKEEAFELAQVIMKAVGVRAVIVEELNATDVGALEIQLQEVLK